MRLKRRGRRCGPLSADLRRYYHCNLSDVLAAPGPFVTVHVGAESAVEQAADRYDLA